MIKRIVFASAALAVVWIGGVAAAEPQVIPSVTTPSLAPQQSIQTEVNALQRQQPNARVHWRPFKLAPALITGLDVPAAGETAREQADDFLSTWSRALGLSPAELQFSRVVHSKDRHGVRYQQMHGALRVTGRYVVVTVSDAGHVLAVSSDAIPFSDVKRGDLGPEQASRAAFEGVHGDASEGDSTLPAEAVVLAEATGAVLAWRVLVPQRGTLEHLVVLVDSRDGQVLRTQRTSQQ